MFLILVTLIANFDRVADLLERIDKRGSIRLAKLSTTLGVVCLAAAVATQLLTDERVSAIGLAGLGTLVTALGLSWLVSRRRRKPKRRRSRKRKAARTTKPPASVGSASKLLRSGRTSSSRKGRKQVRSTKR